MPGEPALAREAGALRAPLLDGPERVHVPARPSVARPEPAAAHPAGARREREFLAGFEALAASTPGALEARAAEVLDGDGPLAEKLALLRALRSSASPHSLAWHEHAVRGDGAELARAALAALLRDAGRDGAARSAIERLAFESPALALTLRRSAAVGFARHCDEAGLARLGAELTRQIDALLVEGALVAVAERDPSAGRTRLLLAHGRSDAPFVAARE